MRRPAGGGVARIAFDSRPAADVRGVGRYTRCLLSALRETAGEGVEIVETHRPAAGSRAGGLALFHSPWMEGAVLRCHCPTVVTLHDLDALTRRSERLRRGGMHTRLRHLALQRATRIIVPTDAMADDALAKLGLERERVVVIPQAPDPTAHGLDRLARGLDRLAPGLDRLAPGQADVSPAWSWEDVARATWQVYERALSEPPRPFISRPRAAKRPPAASARRARS